MGSKNRKVRNQNKARANKVVETTKTVEEPRETQITPSAIKLKETEEQTNKQTVEQNSTSLKSPTIQQTPAKPSILSLTPDNFEVVEVEIESKLHLFESSKKEELKEIPDVKPPVENLPDVKPSLENLSEVKPALPDVKDPIKNLPEVRDPLKNFPEVKPAFENLPDVKPSLENLSEVKPALPEVKLSLKNLPEVKDPVENLPKVEPPLKNLPEVKPAIENLLPEIKHPLENTWGFWLYTNENKKNWTENQKKLTMFDTVEDYWCLYHHIKQPSELKAGQDYAVFKSGISPMWEDPANESGGRWFINLDHRSNDMDRVWLDVVLLMIGENFQNSDVICGAVVNVRQRKRVSVWTRNKDEAANMEIGRKLKNVLRINSKLQFLDHVKNAEIFHA